MKYLTIIMLVLLFMNKSHGQKNVEIYSDVGFVFFDVFEYELDTDNDFFGYAATFKVGANMKHDLSPKLRVKWGLGINMFRFLEQGQLFYDRDKSKLFSAYGLLTLGLERDISSKLSFLAELNTNFLIDRTSGNFLTQRKRYQTIDMGISYSVGNMKIRFTSPITVFPMFYSNTYGRLNGMGGVDTFDSYIELLGANIGISFKL